jgi:ABC-type multidrug transport system fused ATPase/permease subunit
MAFTAGANMEDKTGDATTEDVTEVSALPPADDASTASSKKSSGSRSSSRGKDDEESKTPPASLSKLLGLARPEAPMLVLALLFMIAAEAAGLFNPLLVAKAYDALVNPSLDGSERMTRISRTMLLVIAIHFAGVALGFLRGCIMGIAGERVVSRTRTALYSSILLQEIAFFDEHKTGELVSRLGSDTALMQQGTSQALPEVAIGIIKVAVSIAIMFWISARLAALMIGCVIAIVGICVPFGGLLGRLSKTYQDVLGRAQTHSTEALGAMRTVQSFAAEDRERARYSHVIGDPRQYKFWYPTDRKTHQTTYSVGYFKAVTNIFFFTIIFGFGFGSMYVSLWYGFKQVNDGVISLGQLTAFQSYIFQIGGALGQTSQFISKLIEAQGAASRLFYLLERVPAIPTPVDPKKHIDSDDEAPMPPKRPESMEGAVAFNNVRFAYPSRPDIEVLKDFCLSIPKNQTAALVGSSGAGKSTIVALLQRFYDTSEGEITIDGHDIRQLDLKWMRSQIAYVQQEPQLFGMTVRENIAYGLSIDVTQEQIEEAAKLANAHEFIMQWPDQYETLVGERGVKVSGGQKQRIAIARALLINPKILILDEATSALDAESEGLVQEAINNAVVGRTVLIVAHRLSTIKNADQIVVLDNHRIVDVGSHDVLMNRCSKYKDLIKRQSLVGKVPASL